MLKDRIQLVADIKTQGNMSEFSRVTGLSTGFINKIKDKCHRKSLEAILYAYPDIDWDWLYYGIGSPPLRGINKSPLEYLAESLTELDRKTNRLTGMVKEIKQHQLELF